MKKFLACSAFLIILFIGAMFWMFKKDSHEEPKPITEKPAASAADSVSATDNKKEIPDTTGGYVVKDYKGSIAVFEQGKSTPFRTTGIAVKELPPTDRALLEKGIDASDQEELNLILEDYCS